MQSGWWFAMAVVLVGCGSDNKLDDQLDPDGVGQTPSGPNTQPNGSESTTPPDTDTDTPPTFTTETPTDTGGPGDGTTGPDPLDTGLTDDELCEAAAALSSILDPYQTEGDSRVTYCHSSSGSNWHLIDSDISSCLPHLNHSYDVFPTTGCDS